MHKHTIDLLEHLLTASEEGRIQWTEVPGKTAYSYLAGEFVVLVDANAERTTFRLADAQGRALEQAGVDDLAAATLGTGVSALSAVQSVHAIAKRQTMGTDQAIASVLDHLQGLGGAPEIGDLPAPAAPQTDEDQESASSEPEPQDNGAAALVEVVTQDNAAHGEGVEPIDEGEAENIEQGTEISHDLPVDLPVEAQAPIDESLASHDKKRKRSLLNPFGGKN